jgi:hypothetical protein
MLLRKYLFLIVVVVFTFTSYGADTLWNASGMVGVNASQVSFTNWSQGGENALTWTLYTKMSAVYSDGVWKLSNNLKVAYGRSKIGSAEYRTNDNEFYLENVLSNQHGWFVDPFFSNSVRSTISKGFDYTKSKTNSIADFFDPGYITQSLGFAYDKEKAFKTRLGIGLQETFTNKYRNYSDDPKTADKVEAFSLDAGVESVTNSELNFDDNLLFQSMLRLFTRFNSLDVWDVRWDNTLTAKITKYVNVNLSVLLVYEKAQSPKTQFKEGLQLGFTYSIF